MSFKKDHNIVLLTLGNIAFAKAKRGEKSKALQVSFDRILAMNSKYYFQRLISFIFILLDI